MFRPRLRHWIVRIFLMGVAVGPAGSFAAGTADAADPLTLDDALELIARHHPSLAAARARLLAAEAESEQASAWANPQLGLDAEGFGGNDGSGIEPDEFTLSLGWPLNSLLTRAPRSGMADARVELARASLQHTTWELMSSARLAYHDALVADQLVRLARRRMELTERTVEAFRAQVEAGEASPIQLLRAEVEHETAHSDLGSAEADQRTAHRELAALWSETVDTPLRLADGFRDDVAVGELDSLGQELSRRHPLLLEARWRQELESRGEELAARERWPEIAPRAGIRWLPDADDQDFVAGIGVELPLFDRREAARRAAARRSEAEEQNFQALHLELSTRLRAAFYELRARERALADYDDRIVPRAQDALDRVRIGQEAGKFGALELLDAQRALFAAEQGRLRAHVTYDRILVEIESLLGRGLEDSPAPEAHPLLEEEDNR